MIRHALSFAIITAAAASFFSPTIASASGSASDKASAEALFNEGIGSVNAGQYAEGCSKFEASQALDPTLGTELRLADCYERLGKTASAWALFKESQGIAHRDGERDREELARERAEALSPHLSYLTIQIGEPIPPGLTVQRNGNSVPLPSLGVKIPVDPGSQHIEVTAPERRAWSANTVVPAGPGAITVRVPPLARVRVRALVSAPSLAPAPAVEGPRNVQRSVGIVTSAVGLAALIGGVGLGAYAEHENTRSRSDDYCPTDGHNGCTPAGLDLRQRAQSAATASTVTVIAGGAFLATGIVLWSTAPRGNEHAVQARLHLGASGSPSSFQSVLGGTW